MTLQHSLDSLLQHLALTTQRQTDQVLQERLGIGLSQYKILKMIMDNPGAQQCQLAVGLGQTEASISRQIKLLARKMMIVVEINSKNKRQHNMLLTARGVKLAQAAQDILQQAEEQLFAILGDKQRQQLREILSGLHHEVCSPGKPHVCGVLEAG